MEKYLTILSPFFENPNEKYSIRELSRLLQINHTTVRQYLEILAKENYLTFKKEGIYIFYNLILSKKTLNLKLYYNLEKLRKSNLVEDLEKFYDYPVIVLFGSYAFAMDDITSDIDICIITNIKKEFIYENNLEKYEHIINRKISIHKFSKESFEKTKKVNPNLINNICNGIVLSGELVIV
ncbi:MAG: nucleotidyltransferase domain-containing protein [Candidatus Woesearchaeota archaeon]